MRKEVLWAIVAGVLLGLIVAFGVWRINDSVKNTSSPQPSQSSKTSPAPELLKQESPNTELKVVLDKPQDNYVVANNTVAVSGLTRPSAWVIVSGESKDYILQSDDSGSFTQEVDLVAGANQIKVTVFDNNGEKSSREVLVVYSQNFKLRGDEGAENTEATTESQIRQKVTASLTNTINRPEAYIGTVTDITDSSIELKNKASEIQQISINPEINVTNSTGSTVKQVKTSDIAIGDFIIAMGYKGPNAVLDTQRILITNQIKPNSTFASRAKVLNVTKKTIDIEVDGEKKTTITPSAKTNYFLYKEGKTTLYKLANIQKDSYIIYLDATDSENNPIIRTVFAIPLE